jgi:hypothetical protein
VRAATFVQAGIRNPSHVQSKPGFARFKDASLALYKAAAD